MALAFIPSDAGLLALQAGVVASPRVVPRIAIAQRLRSRAWALLPIASIVGAIFAIRYMSDTATGLTYLALIAVPPLACAALGWASRGCRPLAAIAALPLFILAWAADGSLAGDAAGALLSALSCVTLGVLLAAVTPARWLKLGILLMAGADTWLVISDLLQAPNATLVAAQPAGGLPQLQSELLGNVSLGYGDLFVAGLLGAVLAADRRRQWRAALLTLAIAAVFDLLFLVISELPATVPVALALITDQLWEKASGAWRSRAARHRAYLNGGPVAPGSRMTRERPVPARPDAEPAPSPSRRRQNAQ